MAAPGLFGRIHQRFERGFENMRTTYAALLHTLLTRRIIVPIAAVVILALGGVLFMFVGRDFFPLIDGGQIQLHVRAPAGTRIEKTEQIFQAIEDKIREVVPERDRDLIVDNIGLPARSYNFAFGDGTATGLNDGVILVALKEGHAPTQTLRRKAASGAAGRVSGIGLLLPGRRHGDPDSQFRHSGADRRAHRRLRPDQEPAHRQGAAAAAGGYSRACRRASAAGGRLARNFSLTIDRARATQFGLTANSIALNLNTSLSSSEQVAPNFWTDPSNGTPYFLAVQTPEYRVDTLNELKNTPVATFTAVTSSGRNTVPGFLSNVATFKRDAVPTNANQANVQPVYEIFANAEGRDLGALSGEINKIVAEYQKQMSPGNRIEITGQIVSMNDAFRDLAIGILFAAVFVYLLMVVNYQTWGDPLVVILALPATFCGIVTMLYVTGTTLNVPSLMGAIMAIGVASANSILLVTFAREQQLDGKPAFEAAIAAGRTQIRPVLMTAAAMIVGMIPMAIGGPGEEQNAALARAVIGGLLFATPTTLLVVPYLFAWLRKGNDNKAAHGVFEEEPT